MSDNVVTALNSLGLPVTQAQLNQLIGAARNHELEGLSAVPNSDGGIDVNLPDISVQLAGC